MDNMNNDTEKKREPKYPQVIRSRVSNEDFQRIQMSAQIAGMSVCAFIRKRSTGQHVTAKLDMKIYSELAKIGGSLKKFWSAADAIGNAELAQEATAALRDLREALKRI